MEGLIVLAESMQQASSALEDDDADEQYSSFLNVAAVGSIGSGKSAVLNTIIGYTVLPTGENGATRAPILVEIERDASEKSLAVITDGRVRPVQANEIRLSLQGRLGKIMSASRSSRNDEIRMKLRSTASPPLRLLDLPGITSADDPLVREYAGSNNSTLLIVVPATSIRDVTGSQAMKLVQDIDPDGSRTIGVISKVDQAANDQRSLVAVQTLLTGQGPSITADITWVALIGQSVTIASAHGSDDSLETAWKAEAETLRSILSNAPSGRLGRAALVEVISSQIRKRLKQRLPTLLSVLEGRSQEVEGELARLGEQMVETEEGTRALGLELCREFEDSYILHIDSGETGGWKVISSFEGTLPNRFKQLPLNDIFDLNRLKKVILEADGYQPYLISPEKGLRELVRRALDLAKEPGRSCVDEVHHVLVSIVSAAASSTPGLNRYPPFKREIVAIVTAALEEYRDHAKKMVSNLVDMERSYVPPQHFNRLAQRRMERLRREEELKSRTTRKAQDAEQNLLNKAAPPANQTPPLKTLKDGKDASSSMAGGEILGVYLLKKSTKKAGWSKRWFVLNEKTNRLGYTKTPEERLFRGVINLEECNIEEATEAESGEEPSKSSSKKGDSLNLAFKITSKVPYKSVVKAHAAVLLKAESVSEKQEWMSKLQKCAGVPATKSSSVKQPPAEPPQPRQSLVQDTTVDSVIRRPPDPEEDLRMIGQEVRDYVEAVLNSLSANIPKAVVLCQVERSKEEMLNKLYSSISKQPSAHIQELLQEDPGVKRKRDKCQKQQALLSRLTHQLSMNEARVSAASGYSGPEETSPSGGRGSGEEWRTAFETAGGSGRRRSERRAEENGDIGNSSSSSSSRRTPSRAAPTPPGSYYKG